MAVLSPGAFNQGATYPAEQTRRAIFVEFSGSTGGVVNLSGGDLLMSAPVSGMSVNLATGQCLVEGTSSATQGLYHCIATSTTNLSISASNPSNPRIDLVCATVDDKGYSGGVDDWKLQVVTGTPTSGATLSNLTGAPSLPTSSLLIGYVLVPANATNIIAGDLGDHRVQLAPAISAIGPVIVTGTPTNGQIPVASGSTAAAWGSAGAVVQIANNVLGSGTASVTFSSIPTTPYNSLKLNIIGRVDAGSEANGVAITVNGDSGAHYDLQYVYANNTTVTAGQVLAGNAWQPIFAGSAATANVPGKIEMTLIGYAQTTFWKPVTFLDNIIDYNGATYDSKRDGVWRSTAAITSMTLTPASGNFVTGSTFYLYGIN